MVTSILCVGPLIGPASEVPSTDGIWQSDGYGFVLEISGETARLYSTGRDVCVPETDGKIPISDLLPGVVLEATGDGKGLSLRVPLEPHRINAARLTSLPSGCLRSTPTDAAAVFDAFVGYFDANYPFFALRGIDWPARVGEARGCVSRSMGDGELFELLDWLMQPIRDGHVSLVAEIDGNVTVSSPGRAQILRRIGQSAVAAGADPSDAARALRHTVWFDGIRNGILQGRGHLVGNDRIQYGMLSDKVGYLAFATLDGFASSDAIPAENLVAAQVLLDDIVVFFETGGARSVVLDLSLNFGGSDHIAREVASRFSRHNMLAYTKFAADAVMPVETNVYVEPSQDVRFRGNVLLLTSQITVSAAEVLRLALRNQPHVMHAGERTRGALSDALTRSLPNGWQLSMSNEVYLDAEGRHWEANGIPPEIELTVFSEKDPVRSHQRAISRLVERAM